MTWKFKLNFVGRLALCLHRMPCVTGVLIKRSGGGVMLLAASLA